MSKIKDKKLQKLLNGIESIPSVIMKAHEMLTYNKSLSNFESFKIIFALLHYKRFNDILEKNDEFGWWDPAEICSEHILPEENRWHHLLKASPHQIFMQISNNIKNITCLRNQADKEEPLTGGLPNLEGIDEALNFQKYQSKIPPAIQRDLVNLFNSLDLSFKKISYREFELAIWDFEKKCFLLEDAKEIRTRISFTEPSLAKLIVKLLAPQYAELFYSPFSVFGGVLNLIIDQIYEQSFGLSNFLIELNEKDLEIVALIKLRLATALISNAPEARNWSSPKKWIKTLTICNLEQVEETDIIFLNPLFGRREPDNLSSSSCVDIDGMELEIPIFSSNRGEIFELLQHLRKLSDKGRMSALISFRFLSGVGRRVRNIRKFLIESDYLEAVIQLPEGIFSDTNKTAILVINKNKPKLRKHKTLFLKVKPALEGSTVIISDEEINSVVNTHKEAKGDIEAIVTLEEIQQQDYDLSPELYIGALSKEIKELVESQTGKLLGDICEVTKGKIETDEINYSGFPDVSTKDLSKDIVDCNLDLSNSMQHRSSTDATPHHFVDKKCILVSLVGDDLKPTIYNPDYYKDNDDSDIDNSKIILGRDIEAIIPEEKSLDLEYLYYQLYSPIVQKQFEAFISGDGRYPRITPENIKKIIIPVLESIEEQRRSISQQKAILLERENARHETIKTRLGIFEQIQEAEYKIVRHLSHDIKAKLHIAGSPIETIEDFLEKENLLEKVVSTGMGGSKETARYLLKVTKDNLLSIDGSLNSAKKLVTMEIKMDEFEKTNIFDLFENRILPSYKNKTYSIVLDCEDKDIEAYLHIESFIEAINNIIRNAEMHAFPDNTEGSVLKFKISEDINEEKIIIDYTNNGIRFPDMNEDVYLSFGRKGKNSKGEGLGGAWIGKVIEVHDGTIEIIRDKHPIRFKVTFFKGRSIGE